MSDLSRFDKLSASQLEELSRQYAKQLIQYSRSASAAASAPPSNNWNAPAHQTVINTKQASSGQQPQIHAVQAANHPAQANATLAEDNPATMQASPQTASVPVSTAAPIQTAIESKIGIQSRGIKPASPLAESNHGASNPAFHFHGSLSPIDMPPERLEEEVGANGVKTNPPAVLVRPRDIPGAQPQPEQQPAPECKPDAPMEKLEPGYDWVEEYFRFIDSGKTTPIRPETLELARQATGASVSDLPPALNNTLNELDSTPEENPLITSIPTEQNPCPPAEEHTALSPSSSDQQASFQPLTEGTSHIDIMTEAGFEREQGEEWEEPPEFGSLRTDAEKPIDADELLLEPILDYSMIDKEEQEESPYGPEILPLPVAAEGEIYPPENSELEERPLNDIGQIQVIVTTADSAIPLPGASVSIFSKYHGEYQMQRLLTTNDNGQTAIINVPAPDRALAQSPSKVVPFEEYFVTVRYTGYFPVTDKELQVFGGAIAILPLRLVPLPEDTRPAPTIN